MTDRGVQAIAMETMREYWLVFAAGAAITAWGVVRIRRQQRFAARWVVSTALVAAAIAVALWSESFLATSLAYETLGVPARAGEELREHIGRSWPFLLALGAVLFALARGPRSGAVMTGLVAAAGVLASWMAAMWLFVTNHQPAVFTVLVQPGGLGVVASLVGFPAAIAAWMAIGRWIWGERGRRRVIRGQA